MDKTRRNKTPQLSDPQKVIRMKQIYGVQKARYEDIKNARRALYGIHAFSQAKAHREARDKLIQMEHRDRTHRRFGKGRKTKRRKL
jgi:hypothetical protein